MDEIVLYDDQAAIKEKADKVFDLLDVMEGPRADYKYRIGLFLDFIGQKGFNVNTYLEYKRYLADRMDYAISTKNKYLITAKVFLRELNKQGVIPADITLNIMLFSQTKKHKREGINDEEMIILTDALKALPFTPQNLRLKAILSLLALQGLREIEILRLDIQDIDYVSKVAYVRGKGKDDKEPVCLHPETIRMLREYVKANKVSDGALFKSQSNSSMNERLTTRSLRRIVKNTLGELGIQKTVHGFRHYFTTKLIKVYKGDLLEVARYTRHSGLEMLQVYNDNVKKEADLPRFYGAFSGISF